MEHMAPGSVEQLTEALHWGLASAQPLEIVAGGSKRTIGRPVEARHLLDVGGLRGIVSYQPAELVLTARPGTPLAEIEAVLAANDQMLGFEPPSFAQLLGSHPARATLGGVLGAGFSGPRRIKNGGARDHLLGAVAVSGRAETFSAGGKVVKNVTGYDLPKLLAGSHGTLAVFCELTFKVQPAPEDTRTLVLDGLSATDAVRVFLAAGACSADVSAMTFIPAKSAFPGVDAGQSSTLLRLEGATLSVTARLGQLRNVLASFGPAGTLDKEASLVAWRAIREVVPFAAARDRVLWRICVPPASGAAVLARLTVALPGARALLDWGGGLIWLELADSDDARAAEVRTAIAGQGQALLFRAPAAVRAATEVFHPQAAPLAALSQRVKQQFDPADLLNRGRMNH